MKIGGIMFTFGLFLVIMGVGFENLATSFVIASLGMFTMFISIGVMIGEDSDWIDNDLK